MKTVLGVTGSIAAYKAAALARLLVKAGDEVRVAMTPAACEFVRPLTFKTLVRNTVCVDTFDRPETWEIGHVSLATWADRIVVAPATANTMAKMAHGVADNLLTSVLLAARCKVFVAPAMNCGMWHSPAVKENVRILSSRGVAILGPARGFLACGDEGDGRMLEPEEIAAALAATGQCIEKREDPAK